MIREEGWREGGGHAWQGKMGPSAQYRCVLELVSVADQLQDSPRQSGVSPYGSAGGGPRHFYFLSIPEIVRIKGRLSYIIGKTSTTKPHSQSLTGGF